MKKFIPRQEHRLGPTEAGVTVLDFFDFECLHCAEAEHPLRQVLDAFEGEVALVVRHFPLTESHAWANAAALASEAAANQGKFWEMHDLIFQYQNDLSTEMLLGLAVELGLDTDQFEADMKNADTQARLDQDLDEGERLGVDGTPCIFVNGVRLEDEITFESLSRAVSGLLSPEKAA